MRCSMLCAAKPRRSSRHALPLEERLAGLEPPRGVEELELALAQGLRLGDVDSRIEAAAARLETLGGELDQRLSTLGLFGGSGAELARLPLPSDETTARFARRLSALAARARRRAHPVRR